MEEVDALWGSEGIERLPQSPVTRGACPRAGHQPSSRQCRCKLQSPAQVEAILGWVQQMGC